MQILHRYIVIAQRVASCLPRWLEEEISACVWRRRVYCSSDRPISSKQLNAQLLSLLYKNRLFSRLKFSFNHKDWIVCWLTWTPLCGRTHSLLDPDFLLETIWIKTCFWKTCKYNYLLEDCLNMPSTILNVCLFIFNTCEYKGLFIQGQILIREDSKSETSWQKSPPWYCTLLLNSLLTIFSDVWGVIESGLKGLLFSGHTSGSAKRGLDKLTL